MGDARSQLLERIVDEVATGGLRDRSMREIAAAVGSSHRMLLYHFGTRDGLVAAIVEAVEESQRQLLRDLAADADDVPSLILGLWRQVSSPEVRPFVRLFFDTVAATAGSRAGDHLTAPWLDDSREIGRLLGVEVDPVDVRVGVAVTRGLLVDVLVSDQVEPATAALHRFVEMWERREDG